MMATASLARPPAAGAVRGQAAGVTARLARDAAALVTGSALVLR
jgi:hypothetical protein